MSSQATLIDMSTKEPVISTDERRAALAEVDKHTPLLESILAAESSRVNVYPTESGVGLAVATKLMYKTDVAVADCYIEKGETALKHAHEEVEVFVVYRGHLAIELFEQNEDQVSRTVDITIGGVLEVPVDVPHRVTAVENTNAVMISMPASRGFPGYAK